MNTEAKVLNPHCKPQWPRSVYEPRVARLTEASLAAGTLIDLLLADRNITMKMPDMDDPGMEPFSPVTSEGLWCALRVCMGEIEYLVEGMQTKATAG